MSRVRIYIEDDAGKVVARLSGDAGLDLEALFDSPLVTNCGTKKIMGGAWLPIFSEGGSKPVITPDYDDRSDRIIHGY